MTATVTIVHQGSSYTRYHSTQVESINSDAGNHEPTKQPEIGYWLGEGGKRLGLEGPIAQNDPRLHLLFERLNPQDGTPLGKRQISPRTYKDPKTGKEITYQPVAAIEITFSGEKVYDVLFAASNMGTKRKILSANKNAIAEMVKSLEREIGYTRTGAGGCDRERGGLVCAVFPHQTNRNVECKLHSHLVIFNAVVKGNGECGTLDSRRILSKRFIHKQGRTFRDVLSGKINEQFREYHLPFTQVEIKNGIAHKLEGIPQSLCDAMSTRRQEVVAELSEIKNPTSKQVKVAALKTRKPKPEQIDLNERYREWRALARTYGFDGEQYFKRSRDRYLDRLSIEAAGRIEALRDEADEEVLLKGNWAKNAWLVSDEALRLGTAKAIRREVRQLLSQEENTPSNSRNSVLPGSPEELGKVALASILMRRQAKCQSGWRSWLRRRSLEEQLEREINKSTKRNRWFKWKFHFLYATHQISRKTYLKYTKGKGLPKTQLGIELQYWTGQIKLSQRIYLHAAKGLGIPKVGMPKTRTAIHLSRALNQISEVQRLLLLKKLEQKQQDAGRFKRVRHTIRHSVD